MTIHTYEANGTPHVIISCEDGYSPREEEKNTLHDYRLHISDEQNLLLKDFPLLGLKVTNEHVLETLKNISGRTGRLLNLSYHIGDPQRNPYKIGISFVGCQLELLDTHGKFEEVMTIGNIQ